MGRRREAGERRGEPLPAAGDDVGELVDDQGAGGLAGGLLLGPPVAGRKRSRNLRPASYPQAAACPAACVGAGGPRGRPERWPPLNNDSHNDSCNDWCMT